MHDKESHIFPQDGFERRVSVDVEWLAPPSHAKGCYQAEEPENVVCMQVCDKYGLGALNG